MPASRDKDRPALSPWRGRRGGTIYARATPEKAKITETYEVTQNISVNPSVGMGGAQPGRIEITIPFDGKDYFTQQAARDVERALGTDSPAAGRDVIAGHLLLAGNEHIVLPRDVSMRGDYGVLDLKVPVTAVEDLTADRKACVIAHEYQVGDKFPPIIPASLEIEVMDPDAIDKMSQVDDDIIAIFDDYTALAEDQIDPADEAAMEDFANKYYTEAIKQIRQRANFQTTLLLTIVIRLELPYDQDRPNKPQAAPRIRRVSIDWPTITSLETTTLAVEERHPVEEEVNGKIERRIVTSWREHPVRYNPAEQRLEWEEPQMRDVKATGHARTHSFESGVMQLSIGHPGELYQAKDLKVHAEIEVPGYLMSGLEPRLFDATGREFPRPVTAGQNSLPSLTTRININGTLVVNDRFAKRSFFPYHHVVFDDIIPSEMRITDIRNVLDHLRFKVTGAWDDASDPAAPQWFLNATRKQGPDLMELRIYVEGTLTKRELQEIRGGTMRKTIESTDSGQLKLYMLGKLPGDYRAITSVMNELQQELRVRYRVHMAEQR